MQENDKPTVPDGMFAGRILSVWARSVNLARADGPSARLAVDIRVEREGGGSTVLPLWLAPELPLDRSGLPATGLYELLAMADLLSVCEDRFPGVYAWSDLVKAEELARFLADELVDAVVTVRTRTTNPAGGRAGYSLVDAVLEVKRPGARALAPLGPRPGQLV